MNKRSLLEKINKFVSLAEGKTENLKSLIDEAKRMINSVHMDENRNFESYRQELNPFGPTE